MTISSTDNALVSEGYKLIDDKWSEHGRRTYIHNDEADRGHLKTLARSLQSVGWDVDRDKVRSFRHHVCE